MRFNFASADFPFSTQDMYIFVAGVIFTFLCFFLILRYFG